MQTLVLAILLLTGTGPWVTSAFPFEPVVELKATVSGTRRGPMTSPTMPRWPA
ncbi:MAG: hypothetical protein IT576_07490 [Verrucomicrobiales bacterium]|nr:hypothetical protein [Verrucomicrobiales bacterium]